MKAQCKTVISTEFGKTNPASSADELIKKGKLRGAKSARDEAARLYTEAETNTTTELQLLENKITIKYILVLHIIALITHA